MKPSLTLAQLEKIYHEFKQAESMPTHFTRTQLVKELQDRYGWKLTYLSVINWENKGYIQPDARLHNGKRTVPIYYAKSLPVIADKILLLKLQKKLKIKKYGDTETEKEK